MTWHYTTVNDGSEMVIYDHTGTEVTRLQNDGSGFLLPDDVTDVMRDEARKARTDNDTSRWRDIHIRLADNDIARKE